MPKSLIDGRTMHLVSDLENYYNTRMEFVPGVISIREQVALLPWGEPQNIAKELNIPYPRYPGTKIPCVMTSDLVVEIMGPNGPRLFVLCVKYRTDVDPSLHQGESKEEKSKRKEVMQTLEQLLIEKIYWESRGATWLLCTEETVPLAMFKNLDMLRPTMLPGDYDYLDAKIPEFATLFIREWMASPRARLNQLLLKVSAPLSISFDAAFTLFGRSTWARLIPVDLEGALIHHDSPVGLLLNADAHTESEWPLTN